MKTSSSLFQSGCMHHVFNKSQDSAIIFYSRKDLLYFYTLFSATTLKYEIRPVALCLMPNHFHHGIISWRKEDISGFAQELESKFAVGYNARHRTHGRLFTKSVGFASKRTGKSVRACLLYIADNPVVGNIKADSQCYRWNFIAYKDNRFPFSEPIVKREVRYKLRKACDAVDWWRARNLCLPYKILDQLFEGLANDEAESLTDYIVSAYMVIDYSFTAKYFSNWNGFLAMLKASAGSEHDISDDWDDYSAYGKMSVILSGEGIDLSTVNFELMDSECLNVLMQKVKQLGVFSKKQINRFFHIGKRDK